MNLHSGSPFWPIRDGLPATYPALLHDESADVAIVGAGITGALAAYELSAAGLDVVVLDRDDAASGSTAATSGLLLYDTDSSLQQLTEAVGPRDAGRVYLLGLEAIDRIEALTLALHQRCGFARRPSLYFASKDGHVRDLETEYRLRTQLGLDVAFLTRADIDAAYGFSAPAAIYSQGTAEIDCYAFAHALLQAAAANGARIYDRSPVSGIDCRYGKVTLSVDGHATVRARHVVWATGYDVGLNVGSPGHLTSTWAFVSEPLDDFTGWPDRCLIWETARPYLYMRSTDDGRLLAGGEDEPPATRHERSITFARKTGRLIKRVRQMFPALDIEPDYQWAGTFATTDDGLPFIGQVPKYPNVWFALGYGGNGITFSVIASTILRDALLGRAHPDAELFGFDRHAVRA
jgi:glycine/D-amino acid oxidase-like deaminating enzyme